MNRRRTEILDVGESTLDVGETTCRRNDPKAKRPVIISIYFTVTLESFVVMCKIANFQHC